MNPLDVKAYFLDVAVRLEDFRHTEANKKFARNLKELENQIGSSLTCTNYTLVMEDPNGDLLYQGNFYDRNFYGFWILKRVDKDDFEGEDVAYDGAKQIFFKILSKMYKEHEAGDETSIMRFLDLTSIQQEMAGPWVKNTWGIYVSFGFLDNVQAKVQYDEDAWDPEAVPELLTSLEVADNGQTAGVELTPMVITADAPCTMYLDGNTEGLTLEQLTPTTGQITGTATENTDAVVLAVGTDGGLSGVSLNFVAASMLTDLTASIVSGNNTTIWDAAMEIDVLFTTNAPDSSYSVTNAATLLSTYGLTWNEATRKLTGAPFDNLSTGSNEITVTFEGSDGYSGTVNVAVTITKREVQPPAEMTFDSLVIEEYWDVSDVVEASGVVSQLNGIAGDQTPATQGTSSLRPEIVNGKLVFRTDTMYVNRTADFPQELDFWFLFDRILMSTNEFIMSNSNSSSYIRFSSSESVQIVGSSSGNESSSPLPKELTLRPSVLRVRYSASACVVSIDGGETFSETLGAITGLFIKQFALMSREYNSGSAASHSCAWPALLITSGGSSGDLEKLEGWCADRNNSQAYLASDHAHKTIPPLKPLS